MKLLSCPVLSCLLSLALLCGASEVNASTTVLSNLSEPNYGPGSGIPIQNYHGSGTENSTYAATSFVVGAATGGSVWDLDYVKLSLDNAAPTTTGDFIVAIYANQTAGVPDARPGSVIGTLTGNVSPLTAGVYQYTAAPGTIQLTPGTTYWLVAGSPTNTDGGNGEGYWWNLATTANYTTQSTGWGVDASNNIATFGPGYQSDTGTWHDNNGSVYENVVYRNTSASGTALDLGSDNFLQFSINASVSGVPEPSKAVFLMLGLLGLGLRRKRPLSC